MNLAYTMEPISQGFTIQRSGWAGASQEGFVTQPNAAFYVIQKASYAINYRITGNTNQSLCARAMEVDNQKAIRLLDTLLGAGHCQAAYNYYTNNN